MNGDSSFPVLSAAGVSRSPISRTREKQQLGQELGLEDRCRTIVEFDPPDLSSKVAQSAAKSMAEARADPPPPAAVITPLLPQAKGQIPAHFYGRDRERFVVFNARNLNGGSMVDRFTRSAYD